MSPVKTQDRADPDSDLLGVILAAGKGTRIVPFSVRFPKPVLPILGKPLIQYQVECLRDLGVRRVYVVVGHLGFEVVRTLGDGKDLDVEIEYVEQGATLGIAHALGALEPYLDSPFLLFLGDIFFIHRNLQMMIDLLAEDEVCGVLAVKEESNLDAVKRNYVVLENEEGLVIRVIEKPHHPRTRLKGCGLYLFDPVIFDAVRRTPRTAMRDEYELTDAIQILLNDGYKVKAARVIEDDINLSYPSDLLDINLRLLGTDNMIGRDVKLSPGCRIERSIIMDRVRISHPITIRQSMIFPDVTLNSRTDLERRIVTGEHMIDCR